MPVKDDVIGFLIKQEKLLCENTEISQEVQKKRLQDIQGVIRELDGGYNGKQAV